MPRGDRRSVEMTSENADKSVGGEAKRGREVGRNSPINVPTPTRGGRSGGERRERQSTALEELMRRRGVDEAWTALEEMQANGTQTDKYTISRMLMKTVGDARSRLNPTRVYRGMALVEKFIDQQPKDVDEVLLNALLDTCCRLKDLTRLEATVQRMRDLKITPSPVTLGILVKTYGQAGDIQKVLAVWDEMEKQRGQANAVTYGCMIDACVKCNHLEKAVEIFKGMRESGKHRNTILYTTLIKGYGLDKDLNSALALFREMPVEGVPYNTITYNSIIDACVKGGDLQTAESLLHEIASPASPLEPDLITFSTLLKGYCHSGELDKALQLAEAIKSRGLVCDELVYNTLMDGCVKANDVAAGVGLFEEMVYNGMRPSAITHSILSRLYQRAGYEEDASEAVSQLYAHHGIERPAAGDRGKGVGRHNGHHHRSPHGSRGATPTASPMSGYGMNHDNAWNSWGNTGYDLPYCGSHSGASTPCGSPMQHTESNGLFLPLDAMRGMPPPLPGMGGSEYGTPMSGSYNSFNGSPYMSPTASPGHMQMMAAQGGQAMPQMPAWPFPNGAQMMTMPQGAPDMQAGMGNMMQAPQATDPMQQQQMQVPNNVGPAGSPSSFIVGSTSPAWQGQPAQPQQSPFPMPLSPPHDLAQNLTPGHGQQQQCQARQAFFEFMPENAQGATGQASQSPFCL